MKRFLVITAFAVLAATPAASSAEAYFDVGLGYALGSDVSLGKSCIRDFKEDARQWGCTDNPLGFVGLGYEFQNGLSVSAEHWSGLQDKDYGLDLLTVKYRFRFNQ